MGGQHSLRFLSLSYQTVISSGHSGISAKPLLADIARVAGALSKTSASSEFLSSDSVHLMAHHSVERFKPLPAPRH